MDPYAPPSYQRSPGVPPHAYSDASPQTGPGGQPGPAVGYAPAVPPVGYAPPPVPHHEAELRTLVPPSPTPVLVAGALTAALLALVAVLMGVNALVTSRAVAGGEAAALERLVSPDLGVQLLSGLPWLLQPVCGIAFAVWLMLALQNARAWGTPIRRGPGWAFGAWFVPVLNLWRPKQLVDDVWRGSHPGAPAGTPLPVVPRPGLGYVWWGTWLLAPALVWFGTMRAFAPLVEGAVRAAQSGAPAPMVSAGADPATVLAAMPGMDLVGFIETTALWSLWGYVLWTVCALAAAALVVQVSLWQRERLRAVTQRL